MYFEHTHCRACNYAKRTGPPGIKAAASGEKLIQVFGLGLQPLANDFKSLDEEHAGFAPLKVMFCPRCSLAQLSVVVDPQILYAKNYPYVTSQTRMMFDHFRLLWDSIRERQPKAESVLEIGSNDGTLLKYLKDNGAESVMGIDPAENLVEKANEVGVRTICGLFDSTTAALLSSSMPSIDVIIARHVFCHIDDWQGFVKNLDKVCHKETLVVIEVPYVMDLLDNVQFDTVYHEHLSYMSVKAMAALLDGTRFRLDHVQHVPIHAGAVVLYLRRRDYDTSPDQSVEHYLDLENSRLNADAWNQFNWKAHLNIAALKQTVAQLASEGKTLCGFGASAKSTVWINACGFTKQHLKFITDTTPQKWYKFSPGSDIPIVDQHALLRELPNYAIIFCWNYLSECLKTNQRYLELGGKFLVPVPSIRIIGADGTPKE